MSYSTTKQNVCEFYGLEGPYGDELGLVCMLQICDKIQNVVVGGGGLSQLLRLSLNLPEA